MLLCSTEKTPKLTDQARIFETIAMELSISSITSLITSMRIRTMQETQGYYAWSLAATKTLLLDLQYGSCSEIHDDDASTGTATPLASIRYFEAGAVQARHEPTAKFTGWAALPAEPHNVVSRTTGPPPATITTAVGASSGVATHAPRTSPIRPSKRGAVCSFPSAE
jgi:hypothetical protein